MQSRETANTVNGLGATPLHYAAIYGSVEALTFLLDKDADPNSANQAGATPLIYAAWDFERTRILVLHGANVNATTKQGITPLLVAAATHGNRKTLQYLLDKGADVKAHTRGGEDALMRAALSGDTDMVKLLLERGADAKRADEDGATALQNATTVPDSTRLRLLLAVGSDVNAYNTFAGRVKNGPIALTHMTALMMAAPYGDEDSIECLLKAGARVNERDSRGMTPLMFSIATDHAHLSTVRELIKAGADVQAKDQNGDSVLDWANKYGQPEVIAMLRAAGAVGKDLSAAPLPPPHEPTSVNESIGRAMGLFGKSDFFRAGGGCSGCHHQPAHARAYAAARKANLSTDARLDRIFADSELAVRPRLTADLPYLSTFGGDVDFVFSQMTTKMDLHDAANETSDMMVHFLAARQDPSGAWFNFGVARAPLAESTISRTAAGIEVLSSYSWPARAKEFSSRIRSAAGWLRHAQPETPYEHADRIAGLYAAGIPAAELRADAGRLVELQRQDGGWGQTQYLPADAFATGVVLDTLFRTGLLKPTDAAYRKGVAFLLRTQFPDGSWYVRSRAPKFQPYFQSEFPFDHDQWISSIGTSWAVMALSHAVGMETLAMR